MSAGQLAEILACLDEAEVTLALRQKLVPIRSFAGRSTYVACSPSARRLARRRHLRVEAFAEPQTFAKAVQTALGTRLAGIATSRLARLAPDFSARDRMSPAQAKASATLLALAAIPILLLPLEIVWPALSLAAAMFFMFVIALRTLCLLPRGKGYVRRRRTPSDDELPVYSVLVPLFRETSVLRQLVGGLSCLNYPSHKLDIKIILEEGDLLMRQAVARLGLPAHFEVVVVPKGQPQTKPRALNYGLLFARGSLLTIYDAEDIPEPDQLRIAAGAFAALPEKVACLQAELTFYNPNENWLARQFTVEYATLFGLLLPALAHYRFPIPLGGTSNHFRTASLRGAGAWDPYNVTEDADLGFRLARLGFATGTLPSRTYEEANTRLGNWLNQRSRWLKGFLMTWIVHMRRPAWLWRDLGCAGFMVFQAITFGVFVSALLHPFFVAASLAHAALSPLPAVDAPAWTVFALSLNLLVFVSGYAVAAVAAVRAIGPVRLSGFAFLLLTMPVYWILQSVAAWMALWQFCFAPFRWNKTVHGLSRTQRPPASRH